MAVIVLSANKFLGALTNLVAYATFADTLQRGNVGRFVDSSQSISVPNGNGKVVRWVDILAVQDLSETSTLLSTTKPTVGEQYVPVTQYKNIPLTINRYLLRSAFVDEGQMADFVAYIISVMETTKQAYLYGELIKQYVAYTPAKTATQIVTINLLDTSALTDPQQIEFANVTNAKRIVKSLLNLLREMEAPTDEYNDLGLTEIINRGSLKLVINARQDVDLIVDTFATLFNSGRITEDERWSETIPIPEKQFIKNGMSAADAAKLIGWLLDRLKIQFGYFYEVSTSFFDGSTLNQNYWLHFSIYIAVIQALPAVKLVADYTPAPAPAVQSSGSNTGK